MKEKIDELIQRRQEFVFNKNCYRSEYGGIFSRPSEDVLAWIAIVEDFVIQNFGENSSAFRLYQKFDHHQLTGNYQETFDSELNKLIAVLKACYEICPQKQFKPLLKEDLLEVIFEKFHSVVRQLRKRHDNRSSLDVSDEYDVQDLLHCLLKIHFNDIRAEEWTPSYAGKSARMDFLLKEEEIVIEVKMARKGLTHKELGDQLAIDKARYKVHPNCKKLICFTYDPEGRISNPKGIQSDLNQNDEDFKVEIIIKPDN